MLYDILITSHLGDDEKVLCDCKNQYSYSETDQICRRIQMVLSRLGIQQNDRIILSAERNITTVLLILACIRMGVCFIPVMSEMTEESLSDIIQNASPALMIGGYQSRRHIRSVLANNIMAMSEMEEASDAPPAVHDLIVYILYTSGSTGTPKGVTANESSVEFCIQAINKRLRNTQSDKILCCLPLSFDYGLYQIFLALASGASLFIAPEGPVLQIISILAKEKITGFPAMPAMLNMLLKTGMLSKVDLSSVRYITSTGDVFPVALIQEIQAVIPSAQIVPMYGLTECKRVAIMPCGNPDKILASSCGLPLDGVKVWLEDPDPDGIGELIICGNNVMDGYWNDPGASESCYFSDELGNRCLRSGDLFKIDPDGYLYFISRKKEIIKVNGYRIGIGELENKLFSAMKDLVTELSVFGYPDEIMGEQIAVCVSTIQLPDRIVQQLRSISKQLSPYHRPHLLYCTENPLPKSANGKIDRKQLKEMRLQLDFIKLK